MCCAFATTTTAQCPKMTNFDAFGLIWAKMYKLGKFGAKMGKFGLKWANLGLKWENWAKIRLK